MSSSFITPFSNMAILILLVVVSLVASTTPIPHLPPFHEYHLPSYPGSLIQNNNNNNKPPPVFDYFKLANVWVPTFCMIKTCVEEVPVVDFRLHGLWPQNNSDPQPINCDTTQLSFVNWASVSLF